MSALFRIVALVCLALPLSADSAQEKVSVGIIYDYGGEAIEGYYYSAQWCPDSENKISRDFVSRYEDRFQFEDGGSVLVKTVAP